MQMASRSFSGSCWMTTAKLQVGGERGGKPHKSGGPPKVLAMKYPPGGRGVLEFKCSWGKHLEHADLKICLGR